MANKIRLSRTEWIKAAFRALTEAGPQAIRVESIARDLQVSKGSFYWHFKNLAALKSAMIEHWLELGTHQIIATLEAEGTSPRERLMELVTQAVSDQTRPYGGPKVEAAIRDWARYDGFVENTVAKIDQLRVGYVTDLMVAVGGDQAKASQNADILYATLIGLNHLSRRGGADAKDLLLVTLDLLLTDLTEPKNRANC